MRWRLPGRLALEPAAGDAAAGGAAVAGPGPGDLRRVGHADLSQARARLSLATLWRGLPALAALRSAWPAAAAGRSHGRGRRAGQAHVPGAGLVRDACDRLGPRGPELREAAMLILPGGPATAGALVVGSSCRICPRPRLPGPARAVDPFRGRMTFRLLTAAPVLPIVSRQGAGGGPPRGEPVGQACAPRRG